MERVADNYRLQNLISAWKETIGETKIEKVKNKIAMRYRDKTVRKRILLRYFRIL